MWILPLLGYLGLALGFSFLTLSIASGLYYLSELVEEHSVLAAKLLRRLVYAVIALQALLCLVDRFPWHLTLLGIASQAVYLQNLRHFPYVKLTDPVFLVSCGLVVLNHWVWFQYFGDPNVMVGAGKGARDRFSTSTYQTPSFTEIASYFGICVWLVPFALFVSLSAGENVLPSMGSEYATGEHRPGAADGMDGGIGGMATGRKRKNTGMAKKAIDGAMEWVNETGAVMGLWRGENIRSF